MRVNFQRIFLSIASTFYSWIFSKYFYLLDLKLFFLTLIS